MVKKSTLWIPLLLSACTTDPVPDEDFEGPTSNFPLLGNVPDRPTFPETKTLNSQRNRLQVERHQATEKQAEVVKSIKSNDSSPP